MRIGLAYNLRGEDTEQFAELLTGEDVDRLLSAIRENGHEAVPLEVTGSPDEILDTIIPARPDLIFNVAEGLEGVHREAYYPAIFRMLRIPFTGSSSFVLHVGLDKNLTEAILMRQGICVPRNFLITDKDQPLPEEIRYPVIIKPNAEGSSKGITQASVVENEEAARERICELLPLYAEGLTVEQYIRGREIAVPWLEAWPGGVLEVVEWKFKQNNGYQIMTYRSEKAGKLEAVCPPELDSGTRQAVLALADRAVSALELQDLGRVDIRLSEDGTPYFIETNALPGLAPTFSFMTAARARGLEFPEVIEHIIRSAARRYDIPVKPRVQTIRTEDKERKTVREHGICIGRYHTGENNAITDVSNVCVGHVTYIRDPDESDNDRNTIRTGMTVILPTTHGFFSNHLVCGGFILNGIGEMSGLTQAIEWGWLETPIVLTNTFSIGEVHRGLIRFMLNKHPELGHNLSVVIPLIGETDDSFLNDVRSDVTRADDVLKAIQKASDGPVEQGSVGGGTGMISFDFAGGIGSASRVLPRSEGGYTIGVLVQSNFGKMRNLTIEGKVVGKDLDPLYPYQDRRTDDRGSIIVVLATDAPLLSAQLSQLSKRAALGLGRVGSHASSGSGEIIVSFSTANRTTRMAKEKTRQLNLCFVSDEYINPVYEAAVEATEEAVLNAMFCSAGMDGRLGRIAPPVPVEQIKELIGVNDDHTS